MLMNRSLPVCLSRIRLSLLLSLTACSSIDLDVVFDRDASLQSQIINQQSDRYPEVDPLYLTEEMKSWIDEHIRPNERDFRKVEILQELMFNERYLNVQYSDEHTQTAQEVFKSREGNCLSVMNLYVAVARYAGINASFQTVKVRPTWDRRGGLLVLNQHINATGRVTPRETYVVDFTPEIAVQQLTSAVVSDDAARALYFNNLGVEFMVDGEFEKALPYIQNALWIDRSLSIAWNNIGTVYNRLEQFELAEYAYQMAFEIDDSNATAVNNLARFYIAQGDEDKATRYRRAVTRFNNQNPYYHFEMGNQEYLAGHYDDAILAYRRALRIKQVEPDFYFAAAIAYKKVGNERMATEMSAAANKLLSENGEIFQPSDQKVRFIDSASIIRNSSSGIVVYPNGGAPQ